MLTPIRVLMITSEWPTAENAFLVPFLVQQVDFLRRAGVEIEIFAFRGAKNPLNYVKALWRFNRQYRDVSKFDLVHAQFGQAALIPWPKRWPLVITFHGTDLLGQLSPEGELMLRGRLLRWLSKTTARFADAVVIVSEAMRRNLAPTTPAIVQPTGVDLDALPKLKQAEARERLGLPLEEKLALFVGSPTNPLKRYAEAQEAIALANDHTPVRLILGWGRPHREIIELMLACDVLIVTSAQEGSPTIFKEALACDLPIVSVPVGDAVERFGSIEGCEVTKDRRATTVAEAVERVLRRNCRIKGREAVEDLDEKVLAQRMIGIYRDVIDKAHKRTHTHAQEQL